MTEKTGLAAQHMENCTVTPEQEEGVWLYRVQVTNGSAVLGNHWMPAWIRMPAARWDCFLCPCRRPVP